MVTNKFDYSEDLTQNAQQQCGNEAHDDETRFKTEVRNIRLEERNHALANEFHALKPEISNAYNILSNLVDKTGTLANSMHDLLDLFKTALPLRLSDEDKKVLQNELNAIAWKAAENIRKHENRISLPQVSFWSMVVSLILLSLFFGLVLFANAKLVHSGVLTEIIVVFSLLFVLTLAATVFIFYKQKH